MDDPLADEAEVESFAEDLQIKLTRGQLFLIRMNNANRWHFASSDIELGQPQALCWWLPNEAEQFRVIFGDLSIRNARPDELPMIDSP